MLAGNEPPTRIGYANSNWAGVQGFVVAPVPVHIRYWQLDTAMGPYVLLEGLNSNVTF